MGLWKLLAMLVAVQLAINLGGLGARLSGENYPPLWNLDAEGNIPVWWSGLLLAAASAAAAALAWADARRSRRPLWLLASAILAYLSLDEVAGLHERLGEAITADGGNIRQWVLVLGPLLLLAVVALARLLGALTRRERVLAGGAVALYALALGVEAVSVWLDVARDYPAVAIEENAEMLASSLAIVAMVSALARRVTVVRYGGEGAGDGPIRPPRRTQTALPPTTGPRDRPREHRSGAGMGIPPMQGWTHRD